MSENNSLVFLHLSDLHFPSNRDGQLFDADEDLRNQLERDAINVREQLPYVNGILISGDTAFSGKGEEYQEAMEWLESLSQKLNLPGKGGNIWSVPGNHDVDWSVLDTSDSLVELQNELRSLDLSKDPSVLDKKMNKILGDKSKIELLYKPIENYIDEFASKYSCEINREQPFVDHDFPLNDGSILRLRGVNSTLVSNRSDDNAANKLLLGKFQSTLTTAYGVCYLVLCHHPPSWLIDHDWLQDHWNARSKIQLFGHKHQLRLNQINQSLIISAGATHPLRREPTWQPRYNYISLEVQNSTNGRFLLVSVFPRIWVEANQCFQADFDPSGSQTRKYNLELEPWSRPIISAEEEGVDESLRLQSETPTSDDKVISIDINSSETIMDPARTLTYRFLRLSYVEKLKIAQSLELLQEEDDGLQDYELFARIFRRASETKVLEKLWVRVETAHGDDQITSNPFSGR